MLSDRFTNVIDQIDKLADEGSLDISFFKHGMGRLRELTQELRQWEASTGPGEDPIAPVTGANIVNFMDAQRRRAANNDQ